MVTSSDDHPAEDVLWEVSLYERVGGHATFATIMDAFFARVRDDETLAPMYAHDFAGAQQRLLMFFEQYWGGPTTYSEVRGAPMLRMRHMPYKVSPTAKDRWLRHMHAALSCVPLEPEDEFLLRDYVERAGAYLINADD